MAKVSRIYKRTQVLMITVDVPTHMKGREDQLFEQELNLHLDPAWTTLDGSTRWMEA